MAIDKGSQLGDYDTITREQYRRTNGVRPVPAVAGGVPSTSGEEPVNREVAGFSPPGCPVCGTALTEAQVKRGGIFCGLRCSATRTRRVGNARRQVDLDADEAPLLPIVPPGLHPDDRGVIPIAAALIEVLTAIPGVRVEIHVGPIGPIEVRR